MDGGSRRRIFRAGRLWPAGAEWRAALSAGGAFLWPEQELPGRKTPPTTRVFSRAGRLRLKDGAGERSSPLDGFLHGPYGHLAPARRRDVDWWLSRAALAA